MVAHPSEASSAPVAHPSEAGPVLGESAKGLRLLNHCKNGCGLSKNAENALPTRSSCASKENLSEQLSMLHVCVSTTAMQRCWRDRHSLRLRARAT